MIKSISTKTIAANAIIAALYAVLTVAIAPIAYSQIQFRISEVMVFLAFYNKKYIPGLVAGCIIANMFSPMGLLDIIFGSVSTLVVCIAMYQAKNSYVAAFLGAVITGIIIGGELWYAYQIPYLINAFYVAVGELIVLVIGVIVFKLLEKNDRLMELINE